MKHNFNHKTQPFEHQINAITKIQGNHPVALFDEQGLGKTKMVIAGLVEDMKEKFIESALIVCKKTLIKNWEEEINFHCHLTYKNITGSIKDRRKYMTTFAHFYIVNYESLIREELILKELLKIKKMAIVLDESHKIKNPKSKVAQSILRLGYFSKKNIIITGTPVANKPEDLWSQFYFLDRGDLLGSDFKTFKKKFNIQVGMGVNKFDKNKLQKLQEIITNFAIRRTKKVASPNLPKKKFIYEYVDLYGKQKKMYDLLKEELFLEIKNFDDEIILDDAENILKRLLRLTQITSNPYLIDRSYNEIPVKFKILDKYVSKIILKGEKIIIWTSFVNNIILLKKRYKQHGSLTIYGKMLIEDRNKAVKWFKTDPDYKVLIANPAAAREGLTLTSANNAIYLDKTFNVVDFLQSQDRIHRISQKKECHIISIVANNTVDAYTEELLTKKTVIAKFIQGDSKEIIFPKNLLNKSKLLEILGGKKNE